MGLFDELEKARREGRPDGDPDRPEDGRPDEPKDESREDSLTFNLYYWLQTLVAAVVCIVLVFTFVGRITRVEGSSMVDTLHDGDLLILRSIGYRPRQGDIVVLNKTTDETYSLLQGDAIVKRVIATGGQTVRIDYAENAVYVDDERLEEPYLSEVMLPRTGPFSGQTPVKVPEGSVFVMGDNRNGSTDSRHELLGTVDEGYIMGKAVCVMFPLGRIKTL